MRVVRSEPPGTTTGAETVQEALRNAEPVSLPPNQTAPIRPLGTRNGHYYFMTPANELRDMRAEALEAGRGVRALLSGMGSEIDEWCENNFPDIREKWSAKKAGLWIIEVCNQKGIFDPAATNILSVGVWRDKNDRAVAHCGDCWIDADGRRHELHGNQADVMVSAQVISEPHISPAAAASAKNLLRRLEIGWGWARPEDAAIALGWAAAAALGGFPNKRPHLYINGSRGSGKSTFMGLVSDLLGDFGGKVLTNTTEAGIRQARNNQARPILVDEFEPEGNQRTAGQQDAFLALARSMYDGAGG